LIVGGLKLKIEGVLVLLVGGEKDNRGVWVYVCMCKEQKIESGMV
jgi:hypothetical protein